MQRTYHLILLMYRQSWRCTSIRSSRWTWHLILLCSCKEFLRQSDDLCNTILGHIFGVQ